MKVPLIRQATDYSCGAACVKAILSYFNLYQGTEQDLYPLTFTTHLGTPAFGIMQAAEHFNLKASYSDWTSKAQLKNNLNNNQAVILDIQSWGDFNKETNMLNVWNDGHFVVLTEVGFDYIVVMDPSVDNEYRKMADEELYDCWHDWDDAGMIKEFQVSMALWM